MSASRRRWGWHRLDDDWARRIVDGAALPPGATVLDIGAGTGALTAPLLDAGHRVIAVEHHPGRARQLRDRFGDDLVVVRADAADLRLPRRPFHVVANPPFGVTGPLMKRLLHPGSRLVSAHLVLQVQAARRWAGPSAPGAGRWNARYTTSLGPPVPRQAFRPPPRVDGRLLQVRLRHRSQRPDASRDHTS